MKIIFVIVFICTSFLSHGQERNMKEIQSAMLFSMLKYIQWPGEQTEWEFVLGVLDDDESYTLLKSLCDGKLRGLKKVKVIRLTGVQEVSQCSAVYLGEKGGQHFEEVRRLAHGKPILIVTDGPGLAERGSHINFRIMEGKLRYELNQTVVDQSNLKIAAQLAAMATRV